MMSVLVKQGCASGGRIRDIEVYLQHFKMFFTVKSYQEGLCSSGSTPSSSCYTSNEWTQIHKWWQPGKPEGKIEHNTPVSHIRTTAFLRKFQNLISAPASSSKWERRTRILAADESESTILTHPAQLSGICFILKGSDRTQQQCCYIICIGGSLSYWENWAQY